MALVKKYCTIVKEIEHPLQDIYVITLGSQNGRFKYKPGQFFHLALDEYDPSRQWPESRCFSMQTSPEEEFVKITYSVKGLFTQRMAQELAVGKTVWIKLPYGELFSVEHSKDRCVFVAGGTGITPFLSLFTSAEYSQYKFPKLFLGIRTKGYNIYQRELNLAKTINSHFQVNTIEQDRKGILDIEKIFDASSLSSTYFLSGPPKMISTFKIFLHDKDKQVVSDDWN